jgi:hypothetical protein
MFDQFWEFGRLVEEGAPSKVEITGSHPLLQIFGFRVYVMGMGCQPMSFTHV